MPFLLFAILFVAAVASPLADAEAAPPRRLRPEAGAQAAPIAPAGGIAALRRTTQAQHQPTVTEPTRNRSVVTAAMSDGSDTASAGTTTSQPADDGAVILFTPSERKSTAAVDRRDPQPSPDEQRQRGRSTWIATTVAALGIVLGAFLLLAWLIRRSVPAAMRPLPAEVVEVLGRAPLVGRQQMHMLRFANKLVLVSTTTSGETITLAEIEDVDEVNRVVALCRRRDPSSSSENFRRLLHQFGQDPDDTRFAAGGSARSTTSLAQSTGKRAERGTT